MAATTPETFAVGDTVYYAVIRDGGFRGGSLEVSVTDGTVTEVTPGGYVVRANARRADGYPQVPGPRKAGTVYGSRPEAVADAKRRLQRVIDRYQYAIEHLR